MCASHCAHPVCNVGLDLWHTCWHTHACLHACFLLAAAAAKDERNKLTPATCDTCYLCLCLSLSLPCAAPAGETNVSSGMARVTPGSLNMDCCAYPSHFVQLQLENYVPDATSLKTNNWALIISNEASMEGFFVVRAVLDWHACASRVCAVVCCPGCWEHAVAIAPHVSQPLPAQPLPHVQTHIVRPLLDLSEDLHPLALLQQQQLQQGLSPTSSGNGHPRWGARQGWVGSPSRAEEEGWLVAGEGVLSIW